MPEQEPTTWNGCYNDGWQDNCVPEAFGHPAKFARGLIHRIYRHLVEQGYLTKGDHVLDPFGGVGLGALDAMTYGLSWTGVELEARFCDIANGFDCDGSITFQYRTEHVPAQPASYGWTLKDRLTLEEYGPDGLYGVPGDVFPEDGMRLFETEEAALAWGARQMPEEYLTPASYESDPVPEHTHEVSSMLPARCGGRELHAPHHVLGNLEFWKRRYGYAGARLLQGDSRHLIDVLTKAAIEGVVSSPPYSGNVLSVTDGIQWEKAITEAPSQRHQARGRSAMGDYGTSSGQLGAMPSGTPADGVISSPPFLDQGRTDTRPQGGMKEALPHTRRARAHNSPPGISHVGTTSGQLSGMPPGEADGIISSPPWLDQEPSHAQKDTPSKSRLAEHATKGRVFLDATYGTSSGQLGTMPSGSLDGMVSSPPYAEAGTPDARDLHFDNQVGADGLTRREASIAKKKRRGVPNTYGATKGNIGEMPAGAVDGFVSSPPYAGSLETKHTTEGDMARMARTGVRKRGGMTSGKDVPSNACNQGYGDTPGQLGDLPEGQVDATVSSPPYGTGDTAGPESLYTRTDASAQAMRTAKKWGHGGQTAPENLAREKTETFWSAASQIVAQCVAVLRPGGVTAWVVKDYVSKKKRVDFTGQWRSLCEHHGLRLVEEIHASLVEEHGEQTALFGTPERVFTKRASFFRLLAEKKGSPRIDWETVLIMVKDA